MREVYRTTIIGFPGSHCQKWSYFLGNIFSGQVRVVLDFMSAASPPSSAVAAVSDLNLWRGEEERIPP